MQAGYSNGATEDNPVAAVPAFDSMMQCDAVCDNVVIGCCWSQGEIRAGAREPS